MQLKIILTGEIDEGKFNAEIIGPLIQHPLFSKLFVACTSSFSQKLYESLDSTADTIIMNPLENIGTLFSMEIESPLLSQLSKGEVLLVLVQSDKLADIFSKLWKANVPVGYHFITRQQRALGMIFFARAIDKKDIFNKCVEFLKYLKGLKRRKYF